jgi:TPP-dependent pyruvate/acetoin dehydrogenase alpha subunit
MAEGADAAAVWENPLIPNAKLRQIYLAMRRARLIEAALPRSQRGAMLGLEACIVSTSVDLGPDDLVSDAVAGPLVEFLRGAKLDSVLRPGDAKGARKHGGRSEANCGSAARLPGAPGIQERIWAAVGAAAALKARAMHARIQAKAEGAAATQSAMVVMYASAGEVPQALWRKALTFAAEQQLPVLFVVLPAARPRTIKGRAAKAGGMNAVALRCGVPGIAVDEDDAVAIYRVAQESIGRARIGGGAVLMECVPYIVEGETARGKSRVDAVLGLERHMLHRGVATKTWIDREGRAFEKRIAS